MTVQPEIARFLAALDQTQYLDAEHMRAYQRRPLDRLLRHARAEVPCQADRLAPLFRGDDTIDWDRWDEIPILTRAEAQELGEALKARNLPPAAGKVHQGATSGSTGQVFHHWTNDLQRLASLCANERFFAWHELDPAALTALIRNTNNPEHAYPNGMRSAGWRLPYPQSPIQTLAVNTPIHLQLEWLRRIQPKILWTYPSIVREIGRLALEDKQPLQVDAVLTIGEMISDDMHDELVGLFGHAPLDQYGSAELGHISATCPHSGRHHIASDVAVVEVVDDGGDRVPAGTVGRIVATPLYNYAMPLIRYDSGDLGALAIKPCTCGRTLPTFERIMGRAQTIFRFVDGTRLSPMLLHVREIGRYVPNRALQMAQTALDRVELRYVPMAPDQTNDLAGLSEFVRRNLHPSLSVAIKPMERIERQPSGKFVDFIGLPDGA